MKKVEIQSKRLARASTPKSDGFTLIELMIVVAVIAILASIAYASYSNYIIKSRRGAAATCLLETSQYMERYYTTKLTYVGASPPAQECQSTLSDHYTIALNGTATASAYSVQATPKGQQADKDTKCLVLGLDQKGTRTKSGSGTVADCW